MWKRGFIFGACWAYLMISAETLVGPFSPTPLSAALMATGIFLLSVAFSLMTRDVQDALGSMVIATLVAGVIAVLVFSIPSVVWQGEGLRELVFLQSLRQTVPLLIYGLMIGLGGLVVGFFLRLYLPS